MTFSFYLIKVFIFLFIEMIDRSQGRILRTHDFGLPIVINMNFPRRLNISHRPYSINQPINQYNQIVKYIFTQSHTDNKFYSQNCTFIIVINEEQLRICYLQQRFIYQLQLTLQYFYQLLGRQSMLSNISVNLMSCPRPETATIRNRYIGNNINLSIDNVDSVFMNYDKIILPVKEYSNKFLRESKYKQQLNYNHSICRPKKSFISTKKQIKNRNNRYGEFKIKNKENQSGHRATKTETSLIYNLDANSQTLMHSISENDPQRRKLSHTPSKRYQLEESKKQRISTSRALEKFSKIFRNENIERVKVKREFHHNTEQVKVKQLTLQDKAQKKKVTVGVARRPNINPGSILQRFPIKKMLFNDQNFQLAGW